MRVSTIHNVTGNLVIGGDTSGNGSYTISGNSAQTNVNFVPGGIGPIDPPGLNGIDSNRAARPTPNGALGVGVGGIGTFTQGAANFSDPGNTVAVAGDLVVGVFAGGVGTYTLNTGTLTVGGKMVIGGQSQGANVFTQNGGSVTVTGAASGNADYVGLGGNNFSGSLIVGGGINDLGGGNGTYVMKGGHLTANGAAVGNNGGSGTLAQTGGSASFGTLSLATTSVRRARLQRHVCDERCGQCARGRRQRHHRRRRYGDVHAERRNAHDRRRARIGNQASGNGTYTASEAPNITLTGAGATVVIGRTAPA